MHTTTTTSLCSGCCRLDSAGDLIWGCGGRGACQGLHSHPSRQEGSSKRHTTTVLKKQNTRHVKSSQDVCGLPKAIRNSNQPWTFAGKKFIKRHERFMWKYGIQFLFLFPVAKQQKHVLHWGYTFVIYSKFDFMVCLAVILVVLTKPFKHGRHLFSVVLPLERPTYILFLAQFLICIFYTSA